MSYLRYFLSYLQNLNSTKFRNFAKGKPRYIFMPLHNKKDHMDCVYYATDESALFRQYRLSDSTDISDINESHSVLLYLAEGCLQITLGNFTSRTIEHGMLVFLPKNIGFTGQTIGSSYFIASFFAGRLPLCNKYDLVDLQYQVRQRNGRHLPPPLPTISAISSL